MILLFQKKTGPIPLTQIKFDSGKCEVAWVTARINSVICIQSKTLLKPSC